MQLETSMNLLPMSTDLAASPSLTANSPTLIEESSIPTKQKFKPTFLMFFIALWLIIVVVAGSILALCLFGWILKDDRPKLRIYFEVTSQILNAMFTLSCILTHPGRFVDVYRFIALKRAFISSFATADYSRLGSTKGYDKLARKYVFLGFTLPLDGFDYRHKLDRFTVIITFFHLNCFFQYPITLTMWIFDKDTRPEAVIYSFLPLSFLCGAIGGYLQFMTERAFNRDKAKLLKVEV